MGDYKCTRCNRSSNSMVCIGCESPTRYNPKNSTDSGGFGSLIVFCFGLPLLFLIATLIPLLIVGFGAFKGLQASYKASPKNTNIALAVCAVLVSAYAIYHEIYVGSVIAAIRLWDNIYFSFMSDTIRRGIGL